MRNKLPNYLAVVGIGVVIGLLLRCPSTDIKPNNASTQVASGSQQKRTLTPDDSAGSELANLKIAYEEVVKMSNQLADRISDIENQLDQSDRTDKNNTIAQNIKLREPAGKQKPWFDKDALLLSGIDKSEAERLRYLYEDIELKKLYLRDQALREGWFKESRYHEERSTLDQQLMAALEQLDEDTIDAFLYASGRSNRVIITGTLSGSAAEKAGMKPGDRILRYDNTPIYSWSDLRLATIDGAPDETVPVVLSRNNGKRFTVYVPRGPLGIRLDSTSIAPKAQ